MKTIEFHTKEKFENWTKSIWPGNPALNLDAAVKTFVNPHNGRKTPIWVFGKENGEKSFSYTVSAGANSEWSFTGGCTGCFTLISAQLHIDSMYKDKKLFI